MSSEDEQFGSLSIKSVFNLNNCTNRKKSDIWRHFGILHNNDVPVEDCYHCILCFNNKKLVK